MNKRILNAPAGSSGFTLVELLVTLTIVVLATGLVMVRYVSFNSSVLMNSLAYQIAFDLRETQSLAISIRGSDAGFRQEYGMHFSMLDLNKYLLFQDTNIPNGGSGDDDQTVRENGFIIYDEGEEIGNPIIIDPRFTIMDICGKSDSISYQCYSDNNNYLEFITIAFARPDFDAVIYGEGMGRLDEAEIIIGTGEESSDIARSIVVSSNGQITVK